MNIYELLQNENKTITPEIACMEISLQTFVKLGKISDEQRISFLKTMYCGEQISIALRQYNDFIRNI